MWILGCLKAHRMIQPSPFTWLPDQKFPLRRTQAAELALLWCGQPSSSAIEAKHVLKKAMPSAETSLIR